MTTKTAHWRAVALSTLLFGLIGPFVGGLEALAIGCSLDRCVDAQGSFFGVLPIMFLLAYIAGGGPALLTGALTAFLAGRAHRPWALAFKSALIGGFASGAGLFLREMRGASPLFVVLSHTPEMLLMGAIGALASVPCTGLVLRFKILHARPPMTAEHPA